MPTPSLLIVPSRWKTGNPGKLYSQIPTNGNGDFNVTGVVTGAGNIGTRVNNLGYIEPITTSGTPRLDYYTSSGLPGCPALLVEPSAQNLLQRSEEFNNAYWNKVRCTASANQTTAPDGTLTADKLIMNNGVSPTVADTDGILRNEVITSGAYRFSIFAKAAEFTGFKVRENAVVGNFMDVNLTNGAITSFDANHFISPLAQNYGNGWYRISWTSPTITNLDKYSIRVGSTGDGVSGIFIWGAQVETGSVATSYIPTTTGTVTRAADVISVSGAASGSIGQTEGTIYAEVDVRLLGAAGRTIIECNNRGGQASGSIDARVSLQFSSASGNTLTALVVSGGTTVLTLANTLTSAGIVKIAFGYKTGDSALYVNGVSGGVSTSAFTFPATMNEANLGQARSAVSGLGINVLNDRIRAAALYTTRLTNADLMLLTMPGNNTYLPQAVWDNYLSRTGNAEVPDCLYTRHADLLDV